MKTVEPTELNRACNLLANNPQRAALADEAVEFGPEVAGVLEAFALARA